MDKRKLTVETYACSCEGGNEYGLVIKDTDPSLMEGDDEVMSVITHRRHEPGPKDEHEAYNAYGQKDFTAELVRRFNAHNTLVEALEAIIAELDEYGFIGVDGAQKDDDERHWSWAPSIKKARELLSGLAYSEPGTITNMRSE